ncbi:MAG: GTP-dependent dephospho-CoA kinase family protein [Thermoplasmata archaeon]
MPTDATPFGFGKTLRLPEALRPELRIPLGRLTDAAGFDAEVKGLGKLVTVGDFVTAAALHATQRPRVAVVDFHVERKPDDRLAELPLYEGAKVLEVENPAGQIAAGTWDALMQAYDHPGPVVIRVQGEEDLMALPAIVLAPPGFVVAYGLPARGAVLVDITGESRGRADAFLARMEVLNGDGNRLPSGK